MKTSKVPNLFVLYYHYETLVNSHEYLKFLHCFAISYVIV